MEAFLVIGHLTPTDATDTETWGDQLGRLDADVQVAACSSQEEADHALLWYTDGIVRPLTISTGGNP